MILDAIKVSGLVRRLRPDLPIIFGGWHPGVPSQISIYNRAQFVL